MTHRPLLLLCAPDGSVTRLAPKLDDFDERLVQSIHRREFARKERHAYAGGTIYIDVAMTRATGKICAGFVPTDISGWIKNKGQAPVDPDVKVDLMMGTGRLRPGVKASEARWELAHVPDGRIEYWKRSVAEAPPERMIPAGRHEAWNYRRSA